MTNDNNNNPTTNNPSDFNSNHDDDNKKSFLVGLASGGNGEGYYDDADADYAKQRSNEAIAELDRKYPTTAKAKSKESEKTKEEVISEITYALMSIYHFKTMKDTDEIYYYDASLGIYINDGKSIIRSYAEKVNLNISTHQVNEITNHIIRRTLTDRKDFDTQIEWLACNNCMINLKTLETQPHSPDFMTTIQIPVCFEPPSFITDFFEWVEEGYYYYKNYNTVSCPCPNIMKFMYEVMAAEDVETVLDVIAYSLWRDYLFHKYILFNGSGRNGKGTLLHIISNLLGPRNISAESLQRLLDNKFATARLYGKLANIDADLSSEALSKTGILKKLTGGDYITAEKKFMPPFEFINYAKLWFSANEIPLTSDETDAFFSRLIIINFPRQFLGEDADPNLKYKLTTESELSGLLKLVLKRLSRVLDKGIYVPNSSIGENYQKYMQSSNPVRAFVETAIIRDKDSGPLKEEVYEAYKRFCNDKNLAVETEQSFSRKLKKEHGFEDIQIRTGNARPWFWKGLKLKDWKAPEQGQSALV